MSKVKTIKMPRGVDEGDKKRISVAIDKAAFEDICTFGRNRGWQFSEAINDLVNCGIFDMKEAEEFYVVKQPERNDQ